MKQHIQVKSFNPRHETILRGAVQKIRGSAQLSKCSKEDPGGLTPMTDIVLAGLRGALESLKSELPLMPLSRWNESVFRYYFCRAVAIADSAVEQFVECGKIDLVIAQGGRRAFVEFKFYWKPRRFNPYTGSQKGFKGGPGPKNLGEFQRCINKLAERDTIPGLSKYIVLVYADRNGDGSKNSRFAGDYDDYKHLHEAIAIQSVIVARDVILSPDGDVSANLYEII